MSIKNLINEMVEGILTEIKLPYVVIDTADNNKVVAMASDEKVAKSSIASAERPPMSIKDKNTLKVVKSKKARRIGEYITEAVAKIACLKCDEVSTAAAWQKKGGFCPKCKVSNQGVAESVELDEGVEVSYDRYVRSHGKKPRMSGSGNVMFTSKRMGDVDYDNKDEVFQTYGTAAGAVQAAKKWAKEKGIDTIYFMESVELDENQRSVDAHKFKQAAKVKAGIPLRKPGESLAAYVTRKAKAEAKMKNEEVELSEDIHNDLSDLIFDFQKKLMRFPANQLDSSVAAEIKKLDRMLDTIRTGKLHSVRKGR